LNGTNVDITCYQYSALTITTFNMLIITKPPEVISDCC